MFVSQLILNFFPTDFVYNMSRPVTRKKIVVLLTVARKPPR